MTCRRLADVQQARVECRGLEVAVEFPSPLGGDGEIVNLITPRTIEPIIVSGGSGCLAKFHKMNPP